MIGASVLYNNLSANYKPDSLVVENANSKNNAESNSPNTATNEPSNSSSDIDANEMDNNSSDIDANETDNSSSDIDANETDNSSSDTNDTETSSNTTSEETASKTERIAPDFTVYDLEGNQINLSDFFGKPIIVNFWASWCGPCQMEMPDFDEAYADYKDEIEFLMVNMTDGSRETLEKASSFIKEKGYSFPVYYDTEYSAAITYSVSSLPTTYFIDAEGILTAHARGAIDADTLQKGIDMIYTNE